LKEKKMSKRILGVVLVLGALVASNAYASRARDLVLGTGDAGVMLGNNGGNGSFYTDDAYNMFYNPAYVNDYKNWSIIEKSNYAAGAVSSANNGTSVTNSYLNTGTTAQGGFVSNFYNFNLGLFFNRQDALRDAYYSNESVMRPIDILFGGDMNTIKWGLGLTWASYSSADPTTTGATRSSNDWVVHAGLSYNDFEPFAIWRVSGTDNGLATSPDNKGITAGVRYHWGEWTPYAVFKSESYAGSTDFRAYGAGLGRTTKVTESVKLMYNVSFFRQMVAANSLASSSAVNGGVTTVTSIYSSNGTVTPGDRSVIPINVAVEADAVSWLTVRAGLGYNLMDRVNGVTVADNTYGALGATAHAGKVDFDFAIGQNSGGAGAEGSSDTTTQSFDIAHQFFTAASLQYHW
jgi:hypothetical protein